MNKKTLSIFLAIIFSILLIQTSFAAPVVDEIVKIQAINTVCTFTVEEFEDSYTSDASKPLQSIQITSLPEATVGVLKVKGDVVAENQSISHDDLANITLEPTTDFVGTVVFAYKAFDGEEYSPSANVRITYSENSTIQPPIAEGFSLAVTKNLPQTGKLAYTYTGSESLQFSIVDSPEKGAVEIVGENGEFVYTPHKDQLGEDKFTFRIASGELESNIATATIVISDGTVNPSPSPTAEPIGFVYQDTINHWVNYSATKLVERDIIKGERIGSKYYFYPDTILRRIDVINHLLTSLEANIDDVDKEDMNIFADSESLPDYVNKIAYKAYELGIISGEQVGDEIYLNPYNNVRRVEVVKMLDNAMGAKTRSDNALDFVDADTIPEWAVQHVKNMVGYGILKGYDDNTLRPYENVSKAQSVEMMYQMIKYNEKDTQTLAQKMKATFSNNTNTI